MKWRQMLCFLLLNYDTIFHLLHKDRMTFLHVILFAYYYPFHEMFEESFRLIKIKCPQRFFFIQLHVNTPLDLNTVITFVVNVITY